MLSRLAASLAGGEISETLRRLRTSAVLNLLAALAVLCGLGFLIAAAFVVAGERWGPAPVALVFGLGFLVVAAAVYGGGQILLRRRANEAERRRVSDARLLAGTAALTLLPSILARRGSAGSAGVLLMALVALAGHSIYRENSRARPGDEDEELD